MPRQQIPISKNATAALMAFCLAQSAFAAEGEAVRGNCNSARVPQGCGTYAWPDGSEYVGDFKDGYFDGHGVVTYADGSKFEADFQKGTPRGSASFTVSDGTSISGAFRNVANDGSHPRVTPKYPFWRSITGGHAHVVLTVVVRQDGRVANVKVDQPTEYPSYEEAATDAVKQWTYLPATIDGKPVSVPHRIEIDFPEPRDGS